MWYRGVRLLRLSKVEKALRRFFASQGPFPKPDLAFPGGSNKIGPMGYFMLSIPVVTFGLGTWQIQRLEWKNNLVKSLLEKTRAEPIDLPADLSELSALEYRPVRVRGSYDHSREVYVGPRSLIVNSGDEELGRSGLLSTGRSGAHVITPFQVADSDVEILVNRGWVRREQIPPFTRGPGQIEGEHEIVGVVRLTEQRGNFSPANQYNEKARMHLYRDVEKIASQLGTSPVFLDLCAESTVPGAPQAGQTRVSLRNEHLSYIFTWYLLSACTAIMWYRRFVVLPRIRMQALRSGGNPDNFQHGGRWR